MKKLSIEIPEEQSMKAETDAQLKSARINSKNNSIH